MKRPTFFALALLAVGAAQADPARALAAGCVACHGTRGVAVDGLLPLAGKPRDYLLQQLHEFRSGKRPSTVMQQIAKGYTDAELETLAGYFAAQSSGAAR